MEASSTLLSRRRYHSMMAFSIIQAALFIFKNNKEDSTMTKVITFVNQKGGMGKRITAGNLGTGLARQGKKILLIDDEGIGLRLANIHLDTMGSRSLIPYIPPAVVHRDSSDSCNNRIGSFPAGCSTVLAY